MPERSVGFDECSMVERSVLRERSTLGERSSQVRRSSLFRQSVAKVVNAVTADVRLQLSALLADVALYLVPREGYAELQEKEALLYA